MRPSRSDLNSRGIHQGSSKGRRHGLEVRGQSVDLWPINRSTAADASYLTMSLLSSSTGMIAYSNVGSSLLAIASTAAARTRHFLSEQAVTKAAPIFALRSPESSCAAATRTG